MHTASSVVTFLRSLLVALCLGFLVPIVSILIALTALVLIGCIPGFVGLSQSGLQGLANFLMTFGSGNCIEGAIVIGAAFAFVTILFDSYVSYRHRSF